MKPTEHNTTIQESNMDEIMIRLSPSDFDGHTEFDRLTAEQRLMWLSQAAQFYVMYGGLADKTNSSDLE